MTTRKGPGRAHRGNTDVWAALDETTQTIVAECVRRADTFAARLVGLLGRKGLDREEALWLHPCRGIHTMGMRFAIDAVFLDEGRRVVDLREEIAPWRSSGFVKGAVSVLELSAGSIRRAGVAVGNQIDFLPSGPPAGHRENR